MNAMNFLKQRLMGTFNGFCAFNVSFMGFSWHFNGILMASSAVVVADREIPTQGPMDFVGNDRFRLYPLSRVSATETDD